MSRAVANTLLPAKRPASTIARPRPRELPVTNHTCAIQSSYLRSPSYFETARAAGNTVQQEITIARPAERRATRKVRWVDVVGYADMAGETEARSAGPNHAQ